MDVPYCWLAEDAREAPSSGILKPSADWGRVLKAALVPQSIEATGNLQIATRTDIALEDFAVIANTLDDIDDPIFTDAETGAELRPFFHAEHAADFRIRRVLHLVDVSLCDAKFL